MKSIHQLIRISLLFLFISAITFATDYYVDKNASGQNNGSSWADAWESFSAINWSSINPGDTLFISGGAEGDSVTYFEELTVGASGESGNPLIITPGNDAGHNGIVIFDGELANRNCIEFLSSDYVTLNGQNRLKILRGGYNSNGMIRIGNVNDIIIEYCYFNEVKGNGCVRMDGGDYYRTPPHNIIIRHNIMHMGSSNAQSDNIVVNNINGLWIDHNRIIGDNIYASCAGTRHCDNVQVYRHSGNIIMSNNYMYDFDDSDCHQMLMMENMDGINVLYNNVFYMPNKDGGNTILDKSNPYPQKQWHLIHNTMVTGTNGNQANMHANTFSGYNNLWHATHNQSGNHGIDPGSGFDYTKVQGNLFGDNYSSIWENRSLSYIQGLGGETFGDANSRTYVDPMLTNGQELPDVYPDDDFHLLPGSPAIDGGIYVLDGGETLQDLVESFGLEWEDIDGNPRGSSPDIGAYEYDNGPDLTPPTVVGASLQDSVTLVVNFSESLDATTAEDENNYSISNNISVFNASLSGSHVTLQTSSHSFGSYVVTVVNVEDLAGNPIAQNNTANYERIFIPPDSTIKFTVQNVEGVIQEPDHTPEKTTDGLGALDGDPDSRWAAEPMPEDLIFDLGAIRMVSKTRLSFYNWNSGRVYNYSISVSNDHNNWNTIVPQSTSASNEEWTIDEFSLVGARYVRVNFINNNQSDWAGLWEGEIWGPDLPTSVETTLPEEFLLYQNYPNPFNPSTKISWQSPTSGRQTIKIYDVLGNEKVTLVDEYKQAGSYEIEWNANDLPSGIYFYQLKTESFIETKKMTLLK